VDIAVRSTLEIGLLAEDEVQEVVELIVQIDEDCDWYQRRTFVADIERRWKEHE
jgi:hypothetical protein